MVADINPSGSAYPSWLTVIGNSLYFQATNSSTSNYEMWAYSPISIAVTSPNGGETWDEGSTQTITWTDNIADSVKIELIKSSPADTTVIADSTASDSSFTWTVPTGLVTGSDYKVKITGTGSSNTISDESNATFTIAADPGKPTSFTAVAGFSKVDLDWGSNTESDLWLYKVYRKTTNDSTTATVIDTVYQPISSYSDTAVTIGTTYYYWVSAVDSASNEGVKSVGASAVPAAHSIVITNPNGGESWNEGFSTTITWTDDIDDSVKIELYRGSTLATTIADTTLSDGSFPWTVPNTMITASDYIMKITGLGNSSTVSDTSDSTFTINSSPAKPTSLTAVPGDREVTLDWSDNSEADLWYYFVYRNTSNDSANATFVDTVFKPTSTYSDTGLTTGTTYYYWVSAIDSVKNEGVKSKGASATPAATWWVATDGSNSNPGTESAPLLTLKAAIDSAVAGNSIKVKPGTYSGPDNRDLTPGKNLVISSVKGADSTFIDAGGFKRHFTFNGNVDSSFQLIGFTLINGNGNGIYGGSMYINNASPTIKNCVFKNNSVTGNYDGGAIYIDAGSPNTSSPAFDNCTFRDNTTESQGGAIFIRGSSNPSFTSCNIISNKAANATGKNKVTYGGGIYIGNGDPQFTDCKIDSNLSQSGDYSSYGGGVYISSYDNIDNPITFNRCYFRGNSVTPDDYAYGGGLYVQSRVELINCLIAGNTVDGGGTWGYGRGAGIFLNVPSQGGVDGEVKIVNSTIVNNSAASYNSSSNSDWGGGLFISYNTTKNLLLYNSIIWGNTAKEGPSIYDNGISIRSDHNDVQGGGTNGFSSSNFRTNSVNVDPAFTNASSGDYSLSDASAVIGAGAASYDGDTAPSDDILGGIRPNPSGSSPDLGAYENSLSITPYPAQVTGLVASGGNQSVTLSWTANTESDLSYYKIYQSQTAGFTPADSDSVGSVTKDFTTFTATGLDNAIRYYFRVAAVDGDGYEGLASEAVDITPLFKGPVWWIATDGDDANEGSKGSPFASLAAALDSVADGDTIMVKSGTYSGSKNRGLNPGGKNVVIMSEKGADSTIFDASSADRHFTFDSGEDSTFKVVGITFQDGKKTNNNGGSIYIFDSNPTFENCVFNSNKVTSYQGGAIYIYASYNQSLSPTFSNCTFKNNSSESEGGAIYITGNLNAPKFTNCNIIGNESINAAGDYTYTYGGGVFINQGNPSFTDCRIDSNRAQSGNYSSYGGGVYIDSYDNLSSPVEFTRCYFRGNEVTPNNYAYGGAIYTRSRVTLTNSLIIGNVARAGTNYGHGYGGGVYLDVNSQWDGNQWTIGEVRIINCTIADNKAEFTAAYYSSNGGGIAMDNSSQKLTMFNTIIWDNSAEQDAGVFDNGSSPIADYINLQDGKTYAWFNSNSLEIPPGFKNPAGGDYALSDASFCIGAGASTYESISAPTDDITGSSRPNPSGSDPDLGAYENSLDVSPFPAQVMGLTAFGGNQQVTLNWNANTEDDLAKYKVYMDTTNFTPYDSAFVGDTTATTFTVSGLDNATRYFFRVTAVDTAGNEGLASKAVDITPKFVGPVWWVATDGDDGNEGSEGAPFKSLSGALAEVQPGDTIMVKAGTYSGSLNRGIDPDKNVVIMSEKGADSTIFDAGGNDRHFVFNSGEDSTFQVIGFTFQNGKRTSDNGGSMIFSGFWNGSSYVPSAPVIKNCVFKGNQVFDWYTGGAISIDQGSPQFINCLFEGNASESYGGAVAISGSGKPRFSRCTFLKNEANSPVQDFRETRGGAVYINESEPRFSDCAFDSNLVHSGDYGAFGGAVYIDGFNNLPPREPVKFIRCYFRGNSASPNTEAGSGAILTHARMGLVNCVITGNTASAGPISYAYGGGVNISVYQEWNGSQYITGDVWIVNTTIAGNSANFVTNGYESYGGGLYIDNSNQNVNMFNTIIWGNTAGDQGSVYDAGANLNADYNDIENGATYPWRGANSVDIDPDFNDPANGDYSLSDASLVIGGGTTVFDGVNAPSDDILGNIRPNPVDSNPDLGAYENELGRSPYPVQVEGLEAKPGFQEAFLRWKSNPETNIDYYKIYQSTTSGFVPTNADSVGATSDTTFTVQNLTNNQRYFFRVAAVNTDTLEGDPSNQVSVTPRYLGPTWWVATDGSNDGDGNEASPFADLAKAVTEAASGNIIVLKAGAYTGPNNRDLVFDGTKQLTIRSESGASETILDAGFSWRHMAFMGPVDTSFVVRGITFKNGQAPDEGGWKNGGSIVFWGGDFWDERSQRNVVGYPTPRFYDCIFENNNASNSNEYGDGGALNIQNSGPQFYDCEFRQNSSGYRGGAVYIASPGGGSQQFVSNPLFKRCSFLNNTVDNTKGDDAQGGAVTVYDGGKTKFVECLFDRNLVKSSGSTALGGGLHIDGYWNINNENSIRISRSIFTKNEAQGTNGGGGQGGAVNAQAPFVLVNSLLLGNIVSGNWGNGGGIYVDVFDQNGSYGPSYIINNTIVGNECRDNFGNIAHNGGGISMASGWRQTGAWFNNIIYYNQSGSDRALQWDGGSSIALGYLCVDDGEGQPWWDNNTMSMTDPKFRDAPGGDFQLSYTSPLIDNGTDQLGGVQAPVVDIRKYYRLGTPDLGAYEAGASRFVLDLYDNIDTAPRDTTFLNRDQEFTVTLETQDNNGNVVTETATVSWFVTPNDKHVTIVSQDTVTSGGKASITLKATGITGFKFRVGVDIEGAVRLTNLYIIEYEVTGTPPPVSNITINPPGWAPQDYFTVNWDNPDEGAYGREFIGAYVKVGNDVPFFLGDTVTTGFGVNQAAVKVPEMGIWDVRVWLVDELGNENVDSSVVIQAKYDAQPPTAFNIMEPWDGDWGSDKPRFRWTKPDDYPSGIAIYELHLDAATVVNLDLSQVIEEQQGGVPTVYVDATTSIPNGGHEWWVVAVDSAGNSQEADEHHNFGVDTNPPIIEHNNPLTQVNENQTIPQFDVNIFDNESGVSWASFYYRRSGDEGNWNELNAYNAGSISIPGYDVTPDGIDYYILAEDNVGNRSHWPNDGRPFHSVRVIANNVSTDAVWSGGIPSGTSVESYQFFSIPFDVGNAKGTIESVFGKYDKYSWRFFGYEGDWVEFPELPSVVTGKAYFFIYDETANGIGPVSFQFGQGTSNTTDVPYQINATPGTWVFFGNPYNFSVPLDRVYTSDGTPIQNSGSLYTWDGSWIGVGGSLQPWEGYIYKSASATEFYVDGRGYDMGQTAKGVDYENIPFEPGEWIVDISASTGSLRDDENQVGVRTFATDGFDVLDKFEPPLVPGDISLRIDNRKREETPDIYSRDIRSVSETGQYWDLQVYAPTNGQRTYLSFDGLGYIPEEFDVFLVNKTTQTAQNLKWNPVYSFANSGSDDYLKQEFRFLVGTKEFLGKNNMGVNLYPDAYRLSQNFPNPFNPQTSILISLENDATVDLVVYNLLGAEIARLAVNEHRPAGYYTFIWDGRNTSGDKVATGVYFYHALVRDKNGKVVLNQTKKMVFLK